MATKTAFIFPGQGAQYVGMARDFYQSLSSAKETFDLAGEILQFDLKTVCFHGPEDQLKQTHITQPAIFVHSCIALEQVRQRRFEPHMVAGHSLGEYTALVAAGVLDFPAALRLVKIRGEAMRDAGKQNPGTMAAIIGLEATDVDEICAAASDEGIVQAANYNSPGQIVISGDRKGVARAMELARKKGARRVLELAVGGAFHSPLMEPARERLREALQNTTFHDARVPIYHNATAAPETKADRIRERLDQQLTSPVRWIESTQRMIGNGANRFIEIGPGKVLSGLIRRIDRDVTLVSIDKFTDLDSLQ